MRYDTIRCDTMVRETIRIRYDNSNDTIQHGTMRYDTIEHDTIRYDTMVRETILRIRYDIR